MHHAFGGFWQSVIDSLRVGTAVVGLMFLGYLLNLILFRFGNVQRFAPKAVRRLLASITATLLIVLACFTRLGDNLSFFLPLGIVYIYFATTGYHVSVPPEHAVSEDALRDAQEVTDD